MTTNRRPAPITTYDWYDCGCGFTCPHCGQTGLVIAEPGESTTCSCCGMRYWLEVRVMDVAPEMDVAEIGEEQ